jgi:sulfur carrier protein
MSLTIAINGENRRLEDLATPSSLAQVIGELGLKGDRIAVEHNGQIIVRGLWPGTRVEEGDRLEIVHFVGGGSGLRPRSKRWS